MHLTDVFLYIEEKYKLNSIKVGDFTPWVYMRFFLYCKCEHLSKTLDKKGYHKLLHMFFMITRVIKMLTRRSRPYKNVDILFLAGGRRVFDGNSYECTYTDALAEKFPTSFTLERLNNLDHVSPIKTKNVVYIDRIVLRALIKRVLSMLFFRREHKSVYKQMSLLFTPALTELSDKSGISINREQWVKESVKQYFSYKAYYKLYESFIKKTSPKIIIEVCHYMNDAMIINEIAKNRGIPTIELQHGFHSKEHIAYIYPAGDVIAQFPDNIFLFGEYWKTIIAYPLSDKNLLPVGYPYFEKQVEMYKKRKKDRGKVLLILSAPTISDICGYEKIAKDIVTHMASDGWSVIFKLHPIEYSDWKHRYPQLLYSEVNVVSDSPSLYELLFTATAVVGAFSTTIFESIAFNMPIFIHNGYGSHVFDDLIQMGYAEMFDNTDDLCNKLKNLQKIDRPCSDDIWKPDSLNNMVTEVQRLLDEIAG